MYELRFRDLNKTGHGYAFDCDAAGHVDLDSLTDRQREMYLFVRSLVGRDFATPIVQRKDTKPR
jgi:hypothetical protein